MSSTPTTATKARPNLPFPQLSEDLNRMVLLKYLPTPEVDPVTGKQHLNVDACASIICQTRFGVDTWMEAFLPVKITAVSPLLDAFSYTVPIRYLKPGQMNPGALLEIEVVPKKVLPTPAICSAVMSGDHIPALISFLNDAYVPLESFHRHRVSSIILKYNKSPDYYGSPRFEQLLITGVKKIKTNLTVTVIGDLKAKWKWDMKLVFGRSSPSSSQISNLHKDKGLELLQNQKYLEALGFFALACCFRSYNIFGDPKNLGDSTDILQLTLLIVKTYIGLGREMGAYDKLITKMMKVSGCILRNIIRNKPAEEAVPVFDAWTSLAMDIFGVEVGFERARSALYHATSYFLKQEAPALRQALARFERRRDEEVARAKSE